MTTTNSTNPAVTVRGRRGMKSTPFQKSFATVAAFEQWLEKQDGNVTIDDYAQSTETPAK